MNIMTETIEVEIGRESEENSSVVAEEAARLLRLLDKVEAGATIIIRRHGKAVATVNPASGLEVGSHVRGVIEQMQRFQRERGPTLGGELTIREMIEEGRRS